MKEFFEFKNREVFEMVRLENIWILATPISSVGPSISNVTFDIKDSDIKCLFDIDVLHLRYRMSISKVIDIEGIIIRYRQSQTFDIECHGKDCRYRGFMPSISTIHCSISHTDIVYDMEGLSVVRYRRSCHNISVRYRIRYRIHPMSFTAKRKLPLRRLHHACAEDS
jgi:hypothetical protein